VARHQSSWGNAAGESSALLVVSGLYLGTRTLTGTDLSGGFTTLTSIAGASALFVLRTQRRNVVAAGPGWLWSREYVKTRWVRTDRLVRLSWSLSGIEQLLTFVDDEGRRLGLTRTDLSADVRLTAQACRDVCRSLADRLKTDERALSVLGLDRGSLPRD